jgi:carbamate kinase
VTLPSSLLIALGGNAIVKPGEAGTVAQQFARTRDSMAVLARALAAETGPPPRLILTHGNGPQVGALLRENELAAREVPPRPLHVLVAETQGQIGALIQQELAPILANRGVPRVVLTVVTRVVVSARDPAFKHPNKPVGRYYPDAEARLIRKREGWEMTFDGARGGWRRLVPSPRPVDWLERPALERLFAAGWGRSAVAVVAGGGGIPVVARGRGRFDGVEAVIDKDLSASMVARSLNAHTLAIVTDVPAVAIRFGRPGERWLGQTTVSELEDGLKRGEFGSGSMAPKVEAGLEFLRGGGRRFLITDIPSLARALSGEAGTRVGRD